MKVCFVCKDERLEANAELDGKPVHNWHLSEFQRTAISGRIVAEKEEGNCMAGRTQIDGQRVTELYAEGRSAAEIAKELGCHYSAIYTRLKALRAEGGAEPAPKRSAAKSKRPRKEQETPAPAETALAPLEIKEILAPQSAELPTNGHGKARCRVLMFDVENSPEGVLGAIEAIKAALTRV